MSANIFDQFKSRFPSNPAAPFIETPDGRTWSYGDLMSESAKMAHALVAADVKKGDRVAVQVQKSPEALLLYLACLRAGAVFLPLNTAYQAGEVGYFMQDAEPTVFVCPPDARDKAGPLAGARGAPTVMTLGDDGTGSLIDAASGHAAVFDTAACEEDDLAAILYTSGTTGRPKGAMLTHKNLGSNAETLHKTWAFEPSDVLLHILPIFHTHGLFVACQCVLMNGSSMIWLNKFNADEVVRQLPRSTVMMAVPTHYARLLETEGFDKRAAANMRLFTSGSAPLPVETFNAFAEATGHRILERCGMTETGMNTSNPYDGERVAGTVGTPLPGVEIRITDRNGDPVPDGETGMLEVKGPNVFKGYWKKPDKTAEDFRDDGFFITGDMARIEDHGYVAIVGRQKDLVISGGFNVYPKEVEMIIDDLPGVGESAVIGLRHPDFGEAVTAVVTRAENGLETSEEDVIGHVKAMLANFKVPKRVFFVDGLPRNAMGKVRKNVLRETYADTFKG